MDVSASVVPPLLRDGLFLLAHGDSGRIVGSPVHLAAALAGATLIELLLADRVAVVDDRLEVVDPTVTGDSATDDALAAVAVADADRALGSAAAPYGPRSWVTWLADGAYDRTASALLERGVVRHDTARRLGLVPVSRWLVVDPADLVLVRARVRLAVHRRDRPDPATAALCGLIRVLDLHPALLLSMPAADLQAALERVAAAAPPVVRLVLAAVAAVIATATFR